MNILKVLRAILLSQQAVHCVRYPLLTWLEKNGSRLHWPHHYLYGVTLSYEILTHWKYSKLMLDHVAFASKGLEMGHHGIHFRGIWILNRTSILGLIFHPVTQLAKMLKEFQYILDFSKNISYCGEELKNEKPKYYLIPFWKLKKIND